jgi:hypothetical protein
MAMLTGRFSRAEATAGQNADEAACKEMRGREAPVHGQIDDYPSSPSKNPADTSTAAMGWSDPVSLAGTPSINNEWIFACRVDQPEE